MTKNSGIKHGKNGSKPRNTASAPPGSAGVAKSKKNAQRRARRNAKNAAGKGGGASKVVVKLGSDKSRQRARKNFATAGLQSSGLSQSVSREIASGGYEYMGPSPSTSTQYADIHDAMAIAQLLTLHMVARWPTMFNVPPLIGPSTVASPNCKANAA
jgi:peptidyl-tRNA hydrolase